MLSELPHPVIKLVFKFDFLKHYIFCRKNKIMISRYTNMLRNFYYVILKLLSLYINLRIKKSICVVFKKD
jgi:hypothetical protein